MRFDDLDLCASEFDSEAIIEVGLFDTQLAWDCDPDAIIVIEEYDHGLDDTDGNGDWQVLALDRFGDRNVNASY